MATIENECFISVDIEAAGPTPADFSMLSLGACVVGKCDEEFYMELRRSIATQYPKPCPLPVSI